ncbi:hypothetical protein EDD36DRAFT_460822 [Exophiala viscosa]|uniref:EthD domain-containing protein n=1 Tax=Exophiala viscosa TaxID=2486360 RepID=A0AAN6E3E4_9EURO|nr:hypothetical protein EDD36DRAFT_460822 [Exophiala viscosa]
MSEQFLLWVNSQPKPESGTDDELWKKWYSNVHLPELVQSGTTVRALFYQETHDFAGAAEEKSPREYLAIYPTKFEEALNSQEFGTGVNKESAMFPRQKEAHHNGDFDARNYKTRVFESA